MTGGRATMPVKPPASDRPIRVFVHLAHGFGAANWQSRWERGEIIGLNERLPYGYFHAAEDGCTIAHSEDKREGWCGRALRLGLRLVLGFDIVHAWRNRRGIFAADVVWTHTESQHLAVLLLLHFRRGSRRPRVIGQSVWLFDYWHRLSRVRRRFFAALLRQCDLLTVLSPENLAVLRRLFPRCRSEMIAYGIGAEGMTVRGVRPAHRPVRILSLGNDRHRDWPTLIAAVRGQPDCTLRLVSSSIDPKLLRGADNAAVARPRSNDELTALYDWADLVVVPLAPNLHASGITVLLEATVLGLPVICTDTGGLRAYFSEAEIRYVPAQQPMALRQAIVALAGDDAARAAMVTRAQARIVEGGLTSRRFAQRHAELSRELLGLAGQAATPAPDASEGDIRRPAAHAAARASFYVAALALASVTGLALTPPEMAAFARPAVGNGSGELTHNLCGFQRVFDDEFDTLSVSASGEGARWGAHTPWHGDFGSARFADPGPGFPFRIRDGVLQIEARRGPKEAWQSGLLASATSAGTGFSQRYGYFETRMRLPSGPGLWPAFWLNASQRAGATNPGVEIDAIEYYGQFTNAFHSSVHVWDKDPSKSRVADHVTQVPAKSLENAFHTYGVDVEPDWITFFLDGREIWRTATPPELHDPLMILVDLALGGGWPIDRTPSPSILQVDYVRAYRRDPNAAAACARDAPGSAVTGIRQ